MIIWGLFLGLPLLAYGFAALYSPDSVRKFNLFFTASRLVSTPLTILAWAWTAWELDNIGIDVFDMFLKRFPGELLILAAVLAYLTIIWMPKNLGVRALTGVLMLFPASLFRTTRLLLPEGGFAVVHVFVVFAYIAAVVGMYGMFYPWRLEKAVEMLTRRDALARVFGVALALCGLMLVACGFAA